ncbi:uncharacterized protein yc1106_02782 [Curvularia clavata]|uniref:Uncharacterized protein n=1 Tax=Curvularia clavata TaxID=95742 RepID=A0A9Q8Z736_CURCL|nr:uncharacterized protein yc1106_02782 [Curvularia clavata]
MPRKSEETTWSSACHHVDPYEYCPTVWHPSHVPYYEVPDLTKIWEQPIPFLPTDLEMGAPTSIQDDRAIDKTWHDEWEAEPMSFGSSRPLTLLTKPADINLRTHPQDAKRVYLNHWDRQHEPIGAATQRLVLQKKQEEKEKQILARKAERQEERRIQVRKVAEIVGVIDLTNDNIPKRKVLSSDAQITYAENKNENETSQGAALGDASGTSQGAVQGAPQGLFMTMNLGGVRPSFMANMPYNEFKFPKGGAINATIVDIIVLLPQWFRNPRLLTRFMNNGLTTAFHYYILEKYRYLSVHTEEEVERAHEHLSTAYRNNMRKIVASWTRRNHEVPQDWDTSKMDIRDYLPEAAKKPRYEAPESIKFSDLAIGVKLLPQGDDAGDLTRALVFAMNNRKTNEAGRRFHYVFPDDIHIILNQIGRSDYTEANFDCAVIDRYKDAVNSAKTMRFSLASGPVQQTGGSTHSQQQPPQQATYGQSGLTQSLGQSSGYNGFGQPVSMPSYQQWPHQAPVGQQRPAPSPYALTPTYGMPHSYVPNPHQSTSTFEPIAPSPYQSTIAFRPMPMGQASMTTHTRPGASYISPYINRPEQHVHGASRSNARQPAAVVASEVASDLATRALGQPTGDLLSVPDICKYTGEEPVEPLQFPKHCTEEQQTDWLMAANQSRKLGSPPPWLDPLSEQNGDTKQQSTVGTTGPPSPYKKLGSHLPRLDPVFKHDQDAKQQSAAGTIDPPPPCSVLAGYDEDPLFEKIFAGLDEELLFGQHGDIMQQFATDNIDPALLFQGFESHDQDNIGDEDIEGGMEFEDDEVERDDDAEMDSDEDEELKGNECEGDEEELFHYRAQK